MNNTMKNDNKPILQAYELCKSYKQIDGNQLEILKNINLQIFAGQTISILGSSGSGKSTLLHILAGLDYSTSGVIDVLGHNIASYNDNDLCKIRNETFGFVYQFHHLLPEFNALDNVLMPSIISGSCNYDLKSRAIELLNSLGLSNRMHHFPAQLSGGERQRVAIARSLIMNPKLIFADEPTGNLDNTTAHIVLDMFLKLQEQSATSLVIVTHDVEIAKRTQVKYKLHDGILDKINL